LDSGALGFCLYLFALMLPLSVFCLAVVLFALGAYEDPEERPKLFSVVGRAGFLPIDRGGRLIFATIGLVVANGVQVIFLTRAPLAGPSMIIVVYFLGQGLWLATQVRHLHRRPTKERHGKR
jgi:hypothetical protein